MKTWLLRAFALLMVTLGHTASLLAEGPEKLHPVFIHGMWRTNSTFWWNLFRQQPGVMAFNEPLHPDLHHRRPGQPWSQPRSLRHPPLAEDPYAEYDVVGVLPDFDEMLAYRPFIWDETADFPEVKAYFESLIRAAQARGKIPVFKLTRSFLRIPWFKKHFGGTHIYLHRDLDVVVTSYYSFRGTLGYYLRAIAAIIGLNSDLPGFRRVARDAGLKREDVKTASEAQRVYGRQISGNQKKTRQQMSEIVGFLWLKGRQAGVRHADIFVDDDALASTGERDRITTEILERTGVCISLESYRPRRKACSKLLEP